MKKQTSTDLRRKLREQRAAYEELLGLSGAILATPDVNQADIYHFPCLLIVSSVVLLYIRRTHLLFAVYF